MTKQGKGNDYYHLAISLLCSTHVIGDLKGKNYSFLAIRYGCISKPSFEPLDWSHNNYFLGTGKIHAQWLIQILIMIAISRYLLVGQVSISDGILINNCLQNIRLSISKPFSIMAEYLP